MEVGTVGLSVCCSASTLVAVTGDKVVFDEVRQRVNFCPKKHVALCPPPLRTYVFRRVRVPHVTRYTVTDLSKHEVAYTLQTEFSAKHQSDQFAHLYTGFEPDIVKRGPPDKKPTPLALLSATPWECDIWFRNPVDKTYPCPVQCRVGHLDIPHTGERLFWRRTGKERVMITQKPPHEKESGRAKRRKAKDGQIPKDIDGEEEGVKAKKDDGYGRPVQSDQKSVAGSSSSSSSSRPYRMRRRKVRRLISPKDFKLVDSKGRLIALFERRGGPDGLPLEGKLHLFTDELRHHHAVDKSDGLLVLSLSIFVYMKEGRFTE